MLSAVVYRYGIPLTPPAELLAAMQGDGGDGEVTVELAGGCSTRTLIHPRFALSLADPEWWDEVTGRDRSPLKPSAKRRAEQYRMLLEVDDSLTVALPVTLHRPLPPGTIFSVRLQLLAGARPNGKSATYVEFRGEWR